MMHTKARSVVGTDDQEFTTPTRDRLHMKFLLPLAITCLVSACATSPVAFTAASPVAPSNLLEGYAAYARETTRTVRVIVVRDSGMLGAAASVKLSIDGKEVAKLWSSQRLELFLPPSAYIFSVEPSPRLGGALVERDVLISPNGKYAFRISLDGSGSFSLQPSTQLQ